MDDLTQSAVERGRQQADTVLEFRFRILEERVDTAEELGRARGEEVATPDEELVRAAGSAPSRGVLVAEGDSWFDYPWFDVLGLLEDQHHYDVRSVAHRGDTIEAMAYMGGQLASLSRELEKVIRGRHIPRAILLSGGGNDIAGSEFHMLLNHSGSPKPGLNRQVVSGIIDERVRPAYITIISAVTGLCEGLAGRRIPILVHGYDYPVPDGRGYLGGFSVLPGPWLEPGFRMKDYTSLDERKRWTHELITDFNDMLRSLVAVPDFSHVSYVNLLGTLSDDADYKDWWDNELHPTRRGFVAVTDKIAAELTALP